MNILTRVVQQGEAFAVQSQKSENGQMMKCNIVLQEMGGKYENQYAAAMLGNMAQCKYAPGELVAVTLRFTTLSTMVRFIRIFWLRTLKRLYKGKRVKR